MIGRLTGTRAGAQRTFPRDPTREGARLAGRGSASGNSSAMDTPRLIDSASIIASVGLAAPVSTRLM